MHIAVSGHRMGQSGIMPKALLVGSSVEHWHPCSLCFALQNNSQLGFFFFKKEDAEAIVEKVGLTGQPLPATQCTRVTQLIITVCCLCSYVPVSLTGFCWIPVMPVVECLTADQEGEPTPCA